MWRAHRYHGGYPNLPQPIPAFQFHLKSLVFDVFYGLGFYNDGYKFLRALLDASRQTLTSLTILPFDSLMTYRQENVSQPEFTFPALPELRHLTISVFLSHGLLDLFASTPALKVLSIDISNAWTLNFWDLKPLETYRTSVLHLGEALRATTISIRRVRLLRSTRTPADQFSVDISPRGISIVMEELTVLLDQPIFGQLQSVEFQHSEAQLEEMRGARAYLQRCESRGIRVAIGVGLGEP